MSLYTSFKRKINYRALKKHLSECNFLFDLNFVGLAGVPGQNGKNGLDGAAGPIGLQGIVPYKNYPYHE